MIQEYQLRILPEIAANEQKLKEYEGIDLSPYTERLRSVREAAEKQEIANMVKRSRKLSRGDYVGLMRRLEEKQLPMKTSPLIWKK